MRQYTDDQRMEKYLHLQITLHTNKCLCLELLRYNAHKMDALYIWGTGASRTCAFMCHLRRWCTWRPKRLYDLSNLALIKFNTVFFKSRRNWNYQRPHFHWACCWKKNTFDLISGMNPNTSVGSTGARVSKNPPVGGARLKHTVPTAGVYMPIWHRQILMTVFAH